MLRIRAVSAWKREPLPRLNRRNGVGYNVAVHERLAPDEQGLPHYGTSLCPGQKQEVRPLGVSLISSQGRPRYQAPTCWHQYLQLAPGDRWELVSKLWTG